MVIIGCDFVMKSEDYVAVYKGLKYQADAGLLLLPNGFNLLSAGKDVQELEPEEIDLSGVITWQDAIRVMKATCIEADECGPGCSMNEWCQTFNKEGSAPAKWEPIENEEGEE